jgi:hypothetical protein
VMRSFINRLPMPAYLCACSQFSLCTHVKNIFRLFLLLKCTEGCQPSLFRSAQTFMGVQRKHLHYGSACHRGVVQFLTRPHQRGVSQNLLQFALFCTNSNAHDLVEFAICTRGNGAGLLMCSTPPYYTINIDLRHAFDTLESKR